MAPFWCLDGTWKGVLKDMKKCLSPVLILETEGLEQHGRCWSSDHTFHSRNTDLDSTWLCTSFPVRLVHNRFPELCALKWWIWEESWVFSNKLYKQSWIDWDPLTLKIREWLRWGGVLNTHLNVFFLRGKRQNIWCELHVISAMCYHQAENLGNDYQLTIKRVSELLRE